MVGVLLVAGSAVGVAHRDRFAPRWLLTAAALVVLNDAMLLRGYGLVPRLLPLSDWNWQGKAMALTATLIVAALPAFGGGAWG